MKRYVCYFYFGLLPVLAWGWLPGKEEFIELCQRKHWEEGALPLLAEPDETLWKWLEQPMDDDGNTAIHICVRENNLGLLLQLLLRAKPEARRALMDVANNYGNTPLHLAAENGHLPVVQCLLAHGASVSAVNRFGRPPLHLAAENGHLPVVQCLLAHGASVSAVDEFGITPLHWAALNGHLPVVQCLLAHGASVSAVNRFGRPPLHWAARYGHLPVVQCLLAHGASVSAVDTYDTTPLHRAAENGHLPVVQCLLAHGASVSAVDDFGRTSLHWAVSENHQAIAALLSNPPNPDFTPPSLQSLVSFTLWREAGHIGQLRPRLSTLPPLQFSIVLSILGFSQFANPR